MQAPALFMRLPRAVQGTRARLGAIGVLYTGGLLLLILAFALSDNPGLRDAVLGSLSLTSPPVLRGRAGLFFVLAVACLLAGYALFISWSGEATAPHARASAWRLLVLLPLAFVALPPFLSTDVLSYYQQGWVIAEKGASPYTTPPGAFGAFPGVELMKGSNHNALSPYGPVWSRLESGVYRLSGGVLWTGVVLFKLLAAAAAAALAVLTWSIVRDRGPAISTRAAVVVGANPLLLIEGPGMGHNDVLTLAVAMAGIALLMRSGRLCAVAGLALIGVSLLIKALVAIVPLALAVYGLRAAGARAVVRLGLAAALVCAPIAVASSLGLVHSLAEVPRLFGMVNAALPYEISATPANLLRNGLVHACAALGIAVDPVQVKILLLVALFAGVAAFMLYLLKRATDLRDAVHRLGAVYLAATVAASYWRQWYALWPLAFAAVEPRGRWTAIALAYSGAALLTYAVTRSAGVSL